MEDRFPAEADFELMFEFLENVKEQAEKFGLIKLKQLTYMATLQLVLDWEKVDISNISARDHATLLIKKLRSLKNDAS